MSKYNVYKELSGNILWTIWSFGAMFTIGLLDIMSQGFWDVVGAFIMWPVLLGVYVSELIK